MNDNIIAIYIIYAGICRQAGPAAAAAAAEADTDDDNDRPNEFKRLQQWEQDRHRAN